MQHRRTSAGEGPLGEQLSLLRDDDIVRDLAVVLGAGYSCWAASLPVASNLFDFRIEAFGPREARRLARLKEAKSAWDEANPRGLSEQFIADALGAGGKARSDVLWYLVRRISEPFICEEVHAGRVRRHSFMIDDNRAPRPGAEFLRRVVNAGCKGIVTTNYDLLAEYALTTKGFNYGLRGEYLDGRGAHALRRPTPLMGRLPVAKLHGSVSWDSRTKYTEGRRGITGDALIVAPTPEKVPPAELSWAWDLADGILRDSTRVLGFAFNPYDEAVLNLLHSAGEGIHRILLIDIEAPRERAASVWPNAEIESAPPPPEGQAAIDAWLSQT